eukprot:jgi/Bigna1/83936/fgenesh1_pg.119_\
MEGRSAVVSEEAQATIFPIAIATDKAAVCVVAKAGGIQGHGVVTEIILFVIGDIVITEKAKNRAGNVGGGSKARETMLLCDDMQWLGGGIPRKCGRFESTLPQSTVRRRRLRGGSRAADEGGREDGSRSGDGEEETADDDTAVWIDPMCGSGTLCIEAALQACSTAPGLIKLETLEANGDMLRLCQCRCKLGNSRIINAARLREGRALECLRLHTLARCRSERSQSRSLGEENYFSRMPPARFRAKIVLLKDATSA